MKKLIVFTMLFAVGSANAAVTLSNPTSVPTNHVAISQPDSSGNANVQARNRGPNVGDDWRAITQTFVWPSVDDFDGIGLYMGVGNDALWIPTSTQTYTLIIQELDESTVPTSTVLNIEFQLTDDKVADGQWIYIDTDNVALRQNVGRYGFTIAPVETAIDSSLRTFWDTASSDAYLPGLARQYAPSASGDLPKSDAYTAGGSVNDYTFYMLHAQPVVLSNPAGAPTKNVVVSQTDTAGNAIQARNRASNGADWRAISQTFEWTATNALDGVGLYMGAGNDALWASTSTQTYALIIQALDANAPTATVAHINFSLTGDKVADGQWLYLDIPDVGLQSNQVYGFTLCPPANAVDAGLRTFWATASDDALPGEIAHQFDPNVFGLPISGSYTNGGSVNDFSFYLVQSVDEGAAPVATISEFIPFSAGVMQMVATIPGNPALYHPESSPSLTPGAWSVVAHSIDGSSPFVVTNLSYSTASGEDIVIYVETEGSKGFFNIIGEPQ